MQHLKVLHRVRSGLIRKKVVCLSVAKLFRRCYSRLLETFKRLRPIEQQVFAFSLIEEGTTEKVLQFMMPLKSIHSQTMFCSTKNVFLNTTERFKQEKNLLTDTIFVVKKNSYDLFRAAPYRLMLVLLKDVLFHLDNKQCS